MVPWKQGEQAMSNVVYYDISKNNYYSIDFYSAKILIKIFLFKHIFHPWHKIRMPPCLWCHVMRLPNGTIHFYASLFTRKLIKFDEKSPNIFQDITGNRNHTGTTILKLKLISLSTCLCPKGGRQSVSKFLSMLHNKGFHFLVSQQSEHFLTVYHYVIQYLVIVNDPASRRNAI